HWPAGSGSRSLHLDDSCFTLQQQDRFFVSAHALHLPRNPTYGCLLRRISMILRYCFRSTWINARLQVRRFLRREPNIIGNMSDSFETANVTSMAISILQTMRPVSMRHAKRSKSVTAAIFFGELFTV